LGFLWTEKTKATFLATQYAFMLEPETRLSDKDWSDYFGEAVSVSTVGNGKVFVLSLSSLSNTGTNAVIAKIKQIQYFQVQSVKLDMEANSDMFNLELVLLNSEM
jgi:hypothetical protein